MMQMETDGVWGRVKLLGCVARFEVSDVRTWKGGDEMFKLWRVGEAKSNSFLLGLDRDH
jgi:hypothetical protein